MIWAMIVGAMLTTAWFVAAARDFSLGIGDGSPVALTEGETEQEEQLNAEERQFVESCATDVPRPYCMCLVREAREEGISLKSLDPETEPDRSIIHRCGRYTD